MEAQQMTAQSRGHALLRREALEIASGLSRFRGFLLTAFGIVILGATFAAVMAPRPDFSAGTAIAFGVGVFSLGLLVISKL